MNDAEWDAIIRDLHALADVEVAVAARERLHRVSTIEDLFRLRALLEDASYFVREAAAWPVVELAGAAALPELLLAYQRGFDEGHDNDGFTAALIELAAGDPVGVRVALESLAAEGDASMREHAEWLKEFCENAPDA